MFLLLLRHLTTTSLLPLELARDVYESGVFLDSNTSGDSRVAKRVPDVRAWAPECLEDDSFSTKSDVWAFGV